MFEWHYLTAYLPTRTVCPQFLGCQLEELPESFQLVQVRQHRRHDRRSRTRSFKMLGLSPEPAQRRAMTLARLSLTTTPIELLLGRVAAPQVFRGARPPSRSV